MNTLSSGAIVKAHHSLSLIRRTAAATVAFLAMSCAVLIAPGSAQSADHGMVGQPAPEFRLPLHGPSAEGSIWRVSSADSLSLSSLRGKPVILTFWFTGCIPCVQENPTLSRFAEELDGRVHFVAMTMHESPSVVRRYMEETDDLRFPVVYLKGSRVDADYRVIGAPTTFAVDSDGVVRGVYFGRLREPELRALIATAQGTSR